MDKLYKIKIYSQDLKNYLLKIPKFLNWQYFYYCRTLSLFTIMCHFDVIGYLWSRQSWSLLGRT